MLTYKQTTNKTENKPSFKATFIKVKTGLKTQFSRLLPSKTRRESLPRQETTLSKKRLQLLEEEHALCPSLETAIGKIDDLRKRAIANHEKECELNKKEYDGTSPSLEEISTQSAAWKEHYASQGAFITDRHETESQCARAASLKIQLAEQLVESANRLSAEAKLAGETDSSEQIYVAGKKASMKEEFNRTYDRAIGLLNEAFDIYRQLSNLSMLIAYLKEDCVETKASAIETHSAAANKSGDVAALPLSVSGFIAKHELISSSMSSDLAHWYKQDSEAAKLKITEAVQQWEEFGKVFGPP